MEYTFSILHTSIWSQYFIKAVLSCCSWLLPWQILVCYLCAAVELTIPFFVFSGNCIHLYHPWDTVIGMHWSAGISGQKSFGKFLYWALDWLIPVFIEACLPLQNLNVAEIRYLLSFKLHRFVFFCLFFKIIVYFSLYYIPLLLQVGWLDERILEPQYRMFFLKRKPEKSEFKRLLSWSLSHIQRSSYGFLFKNQTKPLILFTGLCGEKIVLFGNFF